MSERVFNQAKFGRQLRALRKERGLSQKELGLRMGLPEDVASPRVNRWELDKMGLSFNDACRLAAAAGVPIGVIVAENRLAAWVHEHLPMLSVGRRKKAETYFKMLLDEELCARELAEDIARSEAQRGEMSDQTPIPKKRSRPRRLTEEENKPDD